MNEVVRCANCREPVEGKPVEKKGKQFCSEACAFDGTERQGPSICGHDNSAAVGFRDKR